MHKTVYDKPYDCLPKDWIAALFHETNGTDARTTKHFWCSALVGYIYTQLGLLSENTDWSILRPSDFSSSYDLDAAALFAFSASSAFSLYDYVSSLHAKSCSNGHTATKFLTPCFLIEVSSISGTESIIFPIIKLSKVIPKYGS